MNLQGVPMNSLANYMLATQIEVLSTLEARASIKGISSLKSKVTEILESVERNTDVPEWDKIH